MITIESYADLEAAVLAYFQAQLPDAGYGLDDYLGKWARVLAMTLWSLKKSVEDADADAAPSDRSSDAALEAWCYLLGLPNGAGGYGRLVAQKATGGVGTVRGTKGTIFANGLQAFGPDGTTRFALSGSVTIPGTPPGSDSIAGNVIAVTAGAVGNLQAGARLTWISPPAGADASFVLSQPLHGGTDLESAASALARIYDRLQNPPKGGTAPDWRAWAATIATVVRAYVYPRRNGTGTVDVVITVAGSGQSRAPSNDLLAAVASVFDANRLVCVEGRRALAPYMPGSHALTVRVRALPASAAYAWDWIDTSGGPWAVAAYDTMAGVHLQLDNPAPSDLIAQIAGGTRPRIQVVNSNGPVVVEQVRCLSYDAGTQTLTLEAELTGTPTVGDAVYAGGPIPAIVGTRIRDYVDALGPSRASGLGDALDSWDDTVRTERIAQIVLDSLDANGERAIADIVKSANVPQVTIAVGVGAPSTSNWQAPDNTINGPELAFLARAYVTQ